MVTALSPSLTGSLDKLSKLQFIAKSTDSGDPLGPDRETYRIIAAGRKAMNSALAQRVWAEQRPPPPFLTWMALSSHLPADVTQELIEARKNFLTKELQREVETLEAFGQATDKMMTAGRLMVSLTVEHFRAELLWLEHVLRELPNARI